MIKTGFSFRQAVGHLPDVVSRLVELGYTEAPIADATSTFGFVPWLKETKDKLRPVWGVELRVTTRPFERRRDEDSWVFLAKRDVADLNRLVAMATLRNAVLTYDEAMHAEGVVKIAQEYCMVDFVDPVPDLYLGLTPATPVGLYRAALKAGLPMLAMPRNAYPRAADKEFYRVVLGKFFSSTQTYPQHVVSDQELIASQPLIRADWDQAIANRKRVLASCRAELKTAKLLQFHSTKSLRQLCEEGAKSLDVDLNNEVYAERLERELKLIKDKAFEDYFFIIADMVNWAKKRMVVGPARGSSCGSLACYLLGITAIDPIPHGLIFERFIDITRADLDFSDKQRGDVIEYAEKKYGNRVARLAAVSEFQPRSALNRVGISLRIPTWTISKVAETAIKRMMGDSRKSSTIEDTLVDTDAGRAMLKEYPESMIAARFEGHPDHSSIHAAGIVVTDQPITEYVAIDGRTKVAMCDKYDAEVLNLLKIDVLGLTQLSIFERTMELLGHRPVSGWLEKIPMGDEKAFEVLNEHKFCGIFQFTGNAMRGLARQIKFESLDDIVAATALVRPGPLASGGTSMWVERRAGRAPISYAHPLVQAYLEETYGVMVYQEQVLRIGREVGNLTWADVTALRKAMSKSLGKEYFDQFGDKWKAEAMIKGMPKEVASKFWDEMCQFGAWAFNKSHSVSYAYVSYWCAYLKAHHPLEFAAATLDAEAEPLRQIELLRELAREGIGYVAVDPDLSTDHWALRDGRLLGPLNNIKGIGPKKMDLIIDRRKEGKSLPAGLTKLLELARTSIDSLYPIRDRLAQLYPRGLSEANVVATPVTPVKDMQPGISGLRVIVIVPNRIIPKDENEPVKVAKRGHKLQGLSKALNMFVRDDDDEMFAKIGRHMFPHLGREIQEGGAGKRIYALKGEVPHNFRMLDVSNFRLLGELE
jgi:DNA polymerase III alpha subunit